MARGQKYRKKNYKFEELRGPENYETWRFNMTLALQDADLDVWAFGEVTVPQPPPMTLSAKPTPEEYNYYYQRKMAIFNNEQSKKRCCSRIIQMVSQDIQRELCGQHSIADDNDDNSSLTPWDPRELWKHLKDFYAPKRWYLKWNLFKGIMDVKINGPFVRSDPIRYQALIQECRTKINDLSFTINDDFKLHALTDPVNNYPHVEHMLMNRAINEDELPTDQALNQFVESQID
ncbi:MAG: hypothetical protein Q9190_000419 [Brigantiaea leucoxantha]